MLILVILAHNAKIRNWKRKINENYYILHFISEHCFLHKTSVPFLLGRFWNVFSLLHSDNRKNCINILIDFRPIISVTQVKDTVFSLLECWPFVWALKSGRFCSGWLTKAKNLLLANIKSLKSLLDSGA